jgi:hypothetical protein
MWERTLLRTTHSFAEYAPAFRIFPGFQNMLRLSEYAPAFRICSGFQNMPRLSEYARAFRICSGFQNMLRVSEYAPAFRMHITYIKEGKEQGEKAFLLLPFHLGEQD